MNPRFPIYIVSKGRADSRMTSKALERMGVPYHVVIEEQEYGDYAAVIDPQKLLILDKQYQRDYDACMKLEDNQSRGSGPARNFAWDHSISRGYEWHWVVDDNIRNFRRMNQNLKGILQDGAGFRVMEDFCTRYINIGMAGPNYNMFTPRKKKHPPFVMNTRIYSCNLIRNDIPFRWRGRYNEDTDLSLRILKSGWCTVLFNAFLQLKSTTQTVKGGNMIEIYKDGTLPKSQMIADLHPDVARVTYRFNRPHHYVDYSGFKNNKLVRRKDALIEEGNNEYGMKFFHRRAEQ